MLVVLRIDLQLSVSPIADSGRLGLDTRLTNNSVTSGGHGGSDLCSPSNMRAQPKQDQKVLIYENFAAGVRTRWFCEKFLRLLNVRLEAAKVEGFFPRFEDWLALPEDVCQSN
jgi:hypothetical protein